MVWLLKVEREGWGGKEEVWLESLLGGEGAKGQGREKK